MPPCVLAPLRYLVMQERFYFGDTVLPLFESGIPLVRQRMRALPDADNITIAYPDEGAWKRFHYQFGDYPEASLIPLPMPMDQWCKPACVPVGTAELSGLCNTINVCIMLASVHMGE